MNPVLEIGDVDLEVLPEPEFYPQFFFDQLVEEIVGPYAFDEIDFHPGDVVVDVGAHVGVVSMYLAKKHPDITIYAYEPMPWNHKSLVANLKANGVKNVIAHKLAVAGDAGYLHLASGRHSGEGGAFHDVGQHRVKARATTLPAIFKKHEIKRCRLLKLDCEGAEHGILTQIGTLRDRIDNFRVELHLNDLLRDMGFSKEETLATLPPEKVRWQFAGDL